MPLCRNLKNSMSKIKNIFAKVRGIRRFVSAGVGRRPDAHWAVLFTLFIFSAITVVAWSGYVFYRSAAPAILGPEDGTTQGSRSFDKRQFERVLEHFAEHEKRFTEVELRKIDVVDPS